MQIIVQGLVHGTKPVYTTPNHNVIKSGLTGKTQPFPVNNKTGSASEYIR